MVLPPRDLAERSQSVDIQVSGLDILELAFKAYSQSIAERKSEMCLLAWERANTHVLSLPSQQTRADRKELRVVLV